MLRRVGRPWRLCLSASGSRQPRAGQGRWQFGRLGSSRLCNFRSRRVYTSGGNHERKSARNPAVAGVVDATDWNLRERRVVVHRTRRRQRSWGIDMRLRGLGVNRDRRAAGTLNRRCRKGTTGTAQGLTVHVVTADVTAPADSEGTARRLWCRALVRLHLQESEATMNGERMGLL